MPHDGRDDLAITPTIFRKPRVALIHYWLVGMRGGEKVLEVLCRMFPQADIYTHVYDPSKISDTINRHKVIETSVGRLPFAKSLYQQYLPFMPRALEELDLTGYDLVISSEAGPAKGVIVPPDAFHLCYCHSPMRYLWDQYHVYRNSAGTLSQFALPHFAHRLRAWDVSSAARVDAFAANSNHVASRIQKYWRRDASVVHPPAELSAFNPVDQNEVGDYYLWAGELAPYKRPDIMIEAFNKLGLPLVVVGGPEKTRQKLQQTANDNITFLGRAEFDVMKDHMAKCRALIFPGEEDFGIVPVEVMASGRPVIAFDRGGARDTVVNGITGLLFRDQTPEALAEAVREFEGRRLYDVDSGTLVRHAQQFSEANFRAGINALLPTELTSGVAGAPQVVAESQWASE